MSESYKELIRVLLGRDGKPSTEHFPPLLTRPDGKGLAFQFKDDCLGTPFTFDKRPFFNPKSFIEARHKTCDDTFPIEAVLLGSDLVAQLLKDIEQWMHFVDLFDRWSDLLYGKFCVIFGCQVLTDAWSRQEDKWIPENTAFFIRHIPLRDDGADDLNFLKPEDLDPAILRFEFALPPVQESGNV